MKKFFIIFWIVVLLLLVGVVAFVLTFNVDQYRPQVEGQLRSALGKPVRLEKISMGWHDGVALSLRGLVVAHDENFQDEFLRVESAKAELELMPFLSHEIQVSSVYVDHPVIRLIKNRNGELQGFEKKPESPEKAVKANPSAQKAAAALSFLVSNIKVDGGEVFYRDESSRQPVEITVRDLDLKIKNVALNQPIDIEAKAALFSRHQNLNVTGSLKVSPEKGNQELRNVHGDLDLDSLSVQELAKLIPSMASSSGIPEFGGNLTFDIDSLKLSAKGMKEFAADMRLNRGKIRIPDLKAPVENISINVLAGSDSIKLQNLMADFAGGKIQGTGAINLKTPKPLTSMSFSVKNLSLENVLEPPLDPQAPQLKGLMSASFQGTATGSTNPVIVRTLAGDGQLNLERGVVINLNVLREVFQKLSMIPGLMDDLRKRLPEDYKEKLNARDTTFENIEIPFAAKDGTVIFNRLNVRTDSFVIQGGGSYGLISQTLGAQMNIFVDPVLSQAFIKSVPALQSLADRSSGAIMIPGNIQGPLPGKPTFRPDYEYLASRLAQDVLGNFFKKTQPQNQTVDPNTGEPVTQQASGTQTTSQEPTTPSKPKLPKGKDILGALLQSALQPDDSSSQQQ